jgi:hypothetical protein
LNKILLATDVVLDVLLDRKPHVAAVAPEAALPLLGERAKGRR